MILKDQMIRNQRFSPNGFNTCPEGKGSLKGTLNAINDQQLDPKKDELNV